MDYPYGFDSRQQGQQPTEFIGFSFAEVAAEGNLTGWIDSPRQQPRPRTVDNVIEDALSRSLRQQDPPQYSFNRITTNLTSEDARTFTTLERPASLLQQQLLGHTSTSHITESLLPQSPPAKTTRVSPRHKRLSAPTYLKEEEYEDDDEDDEVYPEEIQGDRSLPSFDEKHLLGKDCNRRLSSYLEMFDAVEREDMAKIDQKIKIQRERLDANISRLYRDHAASQLPRHKMTSRAFVSWATRTGEVGPIAPLVLPVSMAVEQNEIMALFRDLDLMEREMVACSVAKITHPRVNTYVISRGFRALVGCFCLRRLEMTLPVRDFFEEFYKVKLDGFAAFQEQLEQKITNLVQGPAKQHPRYVHYCVKKLKSVIPLWDSNPAPAEDETATGSKRKYKKYRR